MMATNPPPEEFLTPREELVAASPQIADLETAPTIGDLFFYCDECNSEWDHIELMIMIQEHPDYVCQYGKERQLICPDCGNTTLEVGLITGQPTLKLKPKEG